MFLLDNFDNWSGQLLCIDLLHNWHTVANYFEYIFDNKFQHRSIYHLHMCYKHQSTNNHNIRHCQDHSDIRSFDGEKRSKPYSLDNLSREPIVVI